MIWQALMLWSILALQGSCKESSCSIDLRDDDNLPPIAPILTTYHQDWLLPRADAKITLDTGDVMRISCPGFGFQHTSLSASPFWTTRCMEGTKFLIEEIGLTIDYEDLGCSDWPQETVSVKGEPCGPPETAGSLIEIGFAVSNNVANKVLITSCLDGKSYQSLWSRHVVPSVIDQRNFYGDMPYFADDALYDFQLDVYKYYTRAMQRDTVAVLVGSEALADRYVEQSGDVYMARGHLAPKADFMYTSWQRATYHYINAQAQWQVFNGQNWFYLEDGLREFVARKGKDLTVITGTHGVCELDDVNANKRQIHLNLEMPDMGRLPVPKFYWKMVVDESQGLGVVVIGVNNPHLQQVETEAYHICLADEIPNHPLLDNVYDPHDVQKGIIYACSVAAARAVIPEIPNDLTITGDLL